MRARALVLICIGLAALGLAGCGKKQQAEGATTTNAAQQTTTVDLSEIKLVGLALQRGQQSYAFKNDVNLKQPKAVA